MKSFQGEDGIITENISKQKLKESERIRDGDRERMRMYAKQHYKT